MNFWNKVLGPNWRKKNTGGRTACSSPTRTFSDKTEETEVTETVGHPVQTPPKLKTAKYIGDDEYEKKFKSLFDKLTYRHNSFEVWSDFVTMFACAISNPLDKAHYDEREKLYLNRINKYDKTEQALFPEFAALTIMALDQNPEQDFLGKLFMGFGFGNKRNQQFFTPYHISDMMVRISMDDFEKEIYEHGYFTINDSCCGSGVMLIAAVNEARRRLEQKRINFQNHIMVVAQDIDFTVAMMCYIQISLLGAAGFVKVGNSLTEPITAEDSLDNYWFTPMYFSDVWVARRTVNQVEELLKGGDK